MAAVVAFANQKGGVAKTTSVHSLGDALHERGHRVLLVDTDPQACLTYAMGVDADTLEATLYDLLTGQADAHDIVVRSDDGPDLLPSSIDLAGAEAHLLTRTGREHVLGRVLTPLLADYDFVLIDCGPSLGVLTINALTAAQHLVVPFQCETLSNRGVGQLLETVDDVRSFTNAELSVLGGIATMFDGRTRLAHEVIADIRERHGVRILEPPVPKSVRVAEAPATGSSVLSHAPRSRPAVAYRELAVGLEELL